MTSASGLLRHCGYPRAIKLREAGPLHDRAACAKKRGRGGQAPGCATCGRHSPTCAAGVCVICSAPRGNVFHDTIRRWGETGVLTLPEDSEEIRGWIELLAMSWAPPPGARFELALGLSPNGRYVPVEEPEPHVYVATDGSKLLTAGRADLTWCRADPELWNEGRKVAVVRDWKTGSYPVAHPRENLQLLALGFAAADMFGAEAMQLEINYVRDGVTETETFDVDSPMAADAWADLEAAALLDDQPRPGPHCETCWERRKRTCTFAEQPDAA